ncbi:hypothetical protein EC988_000405 [Linderina pennispora]|nr:hypothetical protein EC988_000405 [Linderina pennispora]
MSSKTSIRSGSDIEKASVSPVDSIDHLTPDEERIMKRYLRKTDMRLMVFLFLGYATAHLNRAVISFAKIVGMEKHLHMSGTQYNTILALFYPTYLVFQTFLNLVYRKVGARKYIPTTIFVSGALSVCILAVKDFKSMIAVRILEGLFQAGFSSAVMFSLSLWYPRKYLTTRIGWIGAAAAVGALLYDLFSLGFSYMVTPKPIYSWQWLYMLVGLMAMASGMYGLVFIRDYPDTASYLNDEERELIGRVMARSNLRASESTVISKKQIVQGLTDWRLMMFMVIDFANSFASASASTWAPITLQSVGYSTTTVMALLVIPSTCASIVASMSGLLARKIGSLGYFQILASILSTIVLTVGVTGVHNKTARTFSILVLPIFTTPACIIAPAWLNVNMRGTDRSAMTNAFTVVASTLGTFTNSYAYLNTDYPLYINGNCSNFGMLGAAIICSIILIWDFKRQNRKHDENPIDISGMAEQEIKDLGNDHPSFRYTL